MFALPFAVNSSLHSYLILAYAGSEKAAEDVGFYYAANAAGRLFGILLSGVLYQFGGITACLIGSAAMLVASLANHVPVAGLASHADRAAGGVMRGYCCNAVEVHPYPLPAEIRTEPRD